MWEKGPACQLKVVSDCAHRPAVRPEEPGKTLAWGVPLVVRADASLFEPLPTPQPWRVGDQEAGQVTRVKQAVQDECPLDGQHPVLVLHVVKEVPVHGVLPDVLGEAHLALVQLPTDATVNASHRLVTGILLQHCDNSLKVETPVNNGAITRKLGTLRVVLQASRPEFLVLRTSIRPHFQPKMRDIDRRKKKNDLNRS